MAKAKDERPTEGRDGKPAGGVVMGADASVRLTALQGGAISTTRPSPPPDTRRRWDADGGQLSAVAFRGDEGEVLRQASAVVGRPVVLWEVIGTRQAVARASSGPDIGARPPGFDLDAILHRWSIRVPVGSRWVTAPGPTPRPRVAPNASTRCGSSAPVSRLNDGCSGIAESSSTSRRRSTRNT